MLKLQWITSYISHYYYYGVSESTINNWITLFDIRKDATSDSACKNAGNSAACCSSGKATENACCNEDNFIRFVTCCIDYNPDSYLTAYCGDVPEKDRKITNKPGQYENVGFERLKKQYSLSVQCENQYLCGNKELEQTNLNSFVELLENQD